MTATLEGHIERVTVGLSDVLPDNWDGDAIGGCALSELADTYGTPLYVVDERHLLDRLTRFQYAFGPETIIAYAAKAFFCVSIAELLAEAGWWVDVVSGGELATAIAGGIPPDRILLHGNVKTDEELEGAIATGVGRVVVDAPDEMERIVRIAAGRPVRTMLRLNVEVGADTHPKIRTTGSEAQFGMTDAEADLAISHKADAVTLHGVHIHIGSQLRDPRVHQMAFEAVLEFAKRRRGSFDDDLIDLDIGGGFGVPYLSSEPVVDVEQFAETLLETVSAHPDVRLMIEPGRSVIANAGIILYRAISRKGTDRPFLAVDGGISDNPRPALYDARYEMRSVSKFERAHDTPFRVVGRHCETSDRLGEMLLPADTGPGDLLVMPATGAYGFSMASRYNMLPRRPVIFVADGQHRIVVPGETLDDLIR